MARICEAATLLSAPALADTVMIVVPFAAGGPVDQLARVPVHGHFPAMAPRKAQGHQFSRKIFG
jgi:hypothetical protein